MEIIIQRGTHQIGGCITEIRTDETRILIDIGEPLPGNNTETDITIPGITISPELNSEYSKPCDAVFVTHYHGDHIGMIDKLLPNIPLFLGNAAREIYSIYCNRTKQTVKKDRLTHANTFTSGHPIQIKDISITPLLTSHSALDAYMFLIEGKDKTILHTGDFSLHGFEGKNWLSTLAEILRQKGITKIDYLISEGTMLPNQERSNPTEQDAIREMKEVIKNHKKIFVVCSSTHIDRIAEFYHNRNYRSPLISDLYQNTILQYITNTYGANNEFYYLPYAYTYSERNSKLLKLMEQYGFVALIRANAWSKKLIQKYYDESDSAIIYSMWGGYLKPGPARNENLCNFLKPYKITAFIHAGGHALPEEIKEFVDTVNPANIIPIHTEHPEEMKNLLPERKILLLEDKEKLYIP